MSNFDEAILTVLEHEGGFFNHPSDPGGATNYGISMRFLKQQGLEQEMDIDHDGDLDIDDIRQMDLEKAKELYKRYWWDNYQYNRINSQIIATKIFDLAVNMGGKQAHKLVQRACKSCGITLQEDGILGPRTRSAINTLASSNELALLASLRSEAAGFYRSLVAAKPQFQDFINGWLNRAYS